MIIKNKSINTLSFFNLVRVERIELSSQVWKTCILTVVLHSQKSTIYLIPLYRICQKMAKEMGWEIGIEPTTFWTTIRRSNQLSYSHHFVKLQTGSTCDSRQASSNPIQSLYQTPHLFTRKPQILAFSVLFSLFSICFSPFSVQI